MYKHRIITAVREHLRKEIVRTRSMYIVIDSTSTALFKAMQTSKVKQHRIIFFRLLQFLAVVKNKQSIYAGPSSAILILYRFERGEIAPKYASELTLLRKAIGQAPVCNVVKGKHVARIAYTG